MSDAIRQRVLRDELTNDPLARGYAAMTDQQAADNLNDDGPTFGRTVGQDYVNSQQLLEAIVPEEYFATGSPPTHNLNDAQRGWWNTFLGGAGLQIGNATIQAWVAEALPGPSDSLVAVQALQSQVVSRATELFMAANTDTGPVKPGEVQRARA